MTVDLDAMMRDLRRIGPAATPDAIAATFALCAQPQRERGSAPYICRDIAYGPDPRHRLDVHTTGTPAGSAVPVVLYVPGGGFVGGDKRLAGLPYYDHVGRWAVEHGMVAVTINYGLAPQHPWPAGARDVAAAVAWTRTHIAGHGGDPTRIVLMGHSAGATHIASFLAGHGGQAADQIAAAVLLSAIYDAPEAARHEHDPRMLDSFHAYFGSDIAVHPERSALPELIETRVPTLFAVGEFDWPVFHRQAALLVEATFRRHDTAPPLSWLAGHTHFSGCLLLGLPHHPLDVPLHTLFARTIHQREA